MRLSLRAFSCYRSRLWTVLLLIVIAALLGLANMSDDICQRHQEAWASPADLQFDVREVPDDRRGITWMTNVSYGWPLLWRQHVIACSIAWANVQGECYSPGRLIGNALLWFVMMAVPTAVCEWLLRRYRPRLRWRLRTMLAAVGIMAALFGWFAAARNRADTQDALIAVCQKNRTRAGIWNERFGPKWLELVGAERFRRYVRGVEFRDRGDDHESQAVFNNLGQLPHLRYLFCEIRQLTPTMVNSLREMRGLRLLSMDAGNLPICDDNEQIWRDCLEAIGAMAHLEQLHLDAGQNKIDSESLAHFAGLANLQRLSLNSVRSDDQSLLDHLPALPNLETVDLRNSAFGDQDLRTLTALPNLKSLNLADTEVTHLGLADLAASQSLEELTINSDAVTPAALESLLAIKRLNKLHIEGISWHRELSGHARIVPLALDGGSAVGVAESDLDPYGNVLEALRRSKPGIIIDRDELDTGWTGEAMMPSGYDNMRHGLDFDLLLHQLIREWHEQRNAN